MSSGCEKSATANLQVQVGGSLTWQKLSPAEFQQLQDFMACKLNIIYVNQITNIFFKLIGSYYAFTGY